MVAAIERGERLACEPTIPEFIHQTMVGCWHELPRKRSSFERLNDSLLVTTKVLVAQARTTEAGRQHDLEPNPPRAADGYELFESGAGMDMDGSSTAVPPPEETTLALDADGYVRDVHTEQQPSHTFDEEGYVAETCLDGGVRPVGSPAALPGTAPLDGDGYVRDFSRAAAVPASGCAHGDAPLATGHHVYVPEHGAGDDRGAPLSADHSVYVPEHGASDDRGTPLAADHSVHVPEAGPGARSAPGAHDDGLGPDALAQPAIEFATARPAARMHPQHELMMPPPSSSDYASLDAATVHAAEAMMRQEKDRPPTAAAEAPSSNCADSEAPEWEDKEASFLHGEIGKEAAEQAMSAAGGYDGTFLVRKQGDAWGLAVVARGKAQHHTLRRQQGGPSPGRFQLNNKALGQECTRLAEVVEYLTASGASTAIKQNLGDPVDPSRTGSGVGRRGTAAAKREASATIRL